jgi:hypothetical protein
MKLKLLAMHHIRYIFNSYLRNQYAGHSVI